jgi:hypothetical protein
MFAYVSLVVAGTPLVLGLVALLRGRREDIPAILRTLRRKDRGRDLPIERGLRRVLDGSASARDPVRNVTALVSVGVQVTYT